MPAADSETVEEVGAGRVRLADELALRGAARGGARQVALGVGGEGRAAGVGLHRLLVRAAAEGDARRGPAHPVREPVHRVLELAVRADAERGDRDGGRAARRVRHVQGGPDLVGLGRTPLLPGLHDRGRPRPGPGEIARHGLGRRMGRELQFRDDAEVAVAGAAQRPEQVLVRRRVGGELLAVGGDDRGPGEAVAGQAVGAGDDPVAAAQHQAGDADRRAGPRRDRDALGGERPVDVDQLGARADHGRAAARPDPVQLGDVDDQPAVARGPTAVGVAAVADRHLGVVGAGVRHDGADVVGVGDIRHGRRLEAVEAGVVELPRRGPGRLAGADQGAVQVAGQRRPGGGGGDAGGRQRRSRPRGAGVRRGRGGGARAAAGRLARGRRRREGGRAARDEPSPFHVLAPSLGSSAVPSETGSGNHRFLTAPAVTER